MCLLGVSQRCRAESSGKYCILHLHRLSQHHDMSSVSTYADADVDTQAQTIYLPELNFAIATLS